MGYLDVEDKRAREYLKDEIIRAVRVFSANERLDGARFVSLDESGDFYAEKEMDHLSFADDCSVSFFEEKSNSILDSLESKDLYNAVEYLNDSELDLVTRLFLKQEDEHDVAESLGISAESVIQEKCRVLEKIRSHLEKV